MKTSSTALAWGGVLFAGALWGGGALVAQQLIDKGGMSPASLAWARFALGMPVLWAWAVWAARRRGRSPQDVGWRDWPWRLRARVAGTGAAMALNVLCWFVAISYLGAALPTVIAVCCAPVLVALVSTLRGYDRMDRALAACLLAALAGTALVVAPHAVGGSAGPDTGAQWRGVAWSFATAVMHTLVVLGNARMPREVSPLSASAWGTLAAAVCTGAVAWAQGVTWPAGAWDWLGALYTGVVTTAVAYVAFAWGARRLGPVAAVVGTLLEPLVAAALAAALLGDHLGRWQLAGAALLCASIVGLSRRRA